MNSRSVLCCQFKLMFRVFKMHLLLLTWHNFAVSASYCMLSVCSHASVLTVVSAVGTDPGPAARQW